MNHTAGLSIALAVIGVLSGYAILEPRAREDAPPTVTASDMSAGYALLYELVSNEKVVTRTNLRNVHSHGQRTGHIGHHTSAAKFKVTHLPRTEQATRDSIDKETRNQILRSHGVDLEFKPGEFAIGRNELRRASGT
jgi:hypothetical protein